MKKLHLDLNQYSNDRDGLENFMDDYFYLTIPRLIECVYQANSFRNYYVHLENHTRQMIRLYEKMKAQPNLWKEIVKSDTFLAEVTYKRFFIDELIGGIKSINSKAIIK